MVNMSKFSWALGVAAALSACGGGSDSTDPASPAPPVSKAEGAYQGTLSSGFSFNAIILENDDAWAIYGTRSASGLTIYGLVQGSGASSDGSFRVNGTRDFYYTGQVFSGSLSATYVPSTSLNGEVISGSQRSTFAATAMSAAEFDYNKPASLSTIAGSWSGVTLGGDNGTVIIGNNGSITANIQGCALTGTAAPRSSGKNVFNVSFTFGGSPCLLPGQSGSGIAVNYKLDNGRNQLIVAGVNGSRTAGTVFLSTR